MRNSKKGYLQGPVLFCVLALLCAACGKGNAPDGKNGTGTDICSSTVFAMDTFMELKLYGGEDVLKQAEDLIAELESAFSVTDENSDVSALNRNGSGKVSASTFELLQSALALCERTEGALDITVYPAVRAWGFTTGEYRVPDEAELKELLPLVNYRAVRLEADGTVALSKNMQIDLGSVAKGYTGNRLAELLRENGVTSAILNLGGNVQTVGTKPDGTPWNVAVLDPLGNGYAGSVTVADKAVITSGGYQRFFERDGKTYHHIIDPATGRPAENGFLSVTVVAKDGLLCDALSTALFVMGPEKAAEFWRTSDDFDALFITPDEIIVTEGLKDVFTPLGEYQNGKAAVLYRDP